MNYIWSQFSNRLHFLCTIDIIVNTDSTHYLLVFMLVIFTCAIDMSEIVHTGNICGGSRTQSYRRLYNEGGWCWFWVQQCDDKLHDLHLLLYIFSGNCVAVLHVVVVSLLQFFKLFSCWNKQLPHKNFFCVCVCEWFERSLDLISVQIRWWEIICTEEFQEARKNVSPLVQAHCSQALKLLSLRYYQFIWEIYCSYRWNNVK
jgi:hypothetical protein